MVTHSEIHVTTRESSFVPTWAGVSGIIIAILLASYFTPTWINVTGVIMTVLLGFLKWKCCSGKFFKTDQILFGKVVIVTGANSGIGKAVVQDLAERGATIILACRNQDAGEKAVRDIQRDTKNMDVKFMHLDLSSFRSIRNFANEFQSSEKRLDILINNAGVIDQKKTTEDGLDYAMCVNYVGPFYLTKLLLPMLKKSSPSRMVNLSSDMWQQGHLEPECLGREKVDSYDMLQIYANSKLAITLWTKELAQHTQDTISCYAVDPGWVSTRLNRNFCGVFGVVHRLCAKIFFRSAKTGAQTVIYCALNYDIENYSGCYFSDCALKELHLDNELSRRLWVETETLINKQAKLLEKE